MSAISKMSQNWKKSDLNEQMDNGLILTNLFNIFAKYKWLKGLSGCFNNLIASTQSESHSMALCTLIGFSYNHHGRIVWITVNSLTTEFEIEFEIETRLYMNKSVVYVSRRHTLYHLHNAFYYF